jgi:hypothetical protein
MEKKWEKKGRIKIMALEEKNVFEVTVATPEFFSWCHFYP